MLLALKEQKKTIYLDPTLEVAPFGVIRPALRGMKALILGSCPGDDASCWTTIGGELPFPSVQRVSVDATLTPDGALNSKVRYVLRGDNELLLRVAFHKASRDRWKEVAQLLALSDGFRGKVSTVTASDPYATKAPFTVQYQITQPNFTDWSKKPVRIPALLPLLGLPNPAAKPSSEAATSNAAAASPIELGTPLEVETRVTLHLPEGATAEVPPGTSVERDYAKFSSQYSVSGLIVTASRHLQFLLRELPASRPADYNAFVRAVQTDEAQEFTLNRATPAQAKRSPAAEAAAPKATP